MNAKKTETLAEEFEIARTFKKLESRRLDIMEEVGHALGERFDSNGWDMVDFCLYNGHTGYIYRITFKGVDGVYSGVVPYLTSIGNLIDNIYWDVLRNEIPLDINL